MDLVYTKNGIEADGITGQYRNADYFQNPETLPEGSKVAVIGDYPHIAEAYKAAGVEVLFTEAKPQNVDLSTLSVKELREHLTTAGIEFPANASKDDLLNLAKQGA
ncbi:HeH/LEM domain-containing protein [Vitreoscilla massiliensis]|uniref:HeH/LEM domain-containing protein n=1 Tax=Vitreoscilla massiliensis TaxID=1689272 RepID=A0ABY4E024_9NEIS|nr:HeH/LEM domain-containing protein [Vitreoscilla massiliensis]UOO89123.1 HeH/LEM domain-containing protein [Vitreoscilla massiliensis]